MKTKTVKLYQFSELPVDARRKALDKHHDINVDYNWHDSTYEDFSQLCEYLGITVDLKHTYFNGFYNQGSGSSFTATIDVLKLVNSVKNESWKEYAPKEVFKFHAVTPNIERVAKLIAAGHIDFFAWVETANRETSVKVESEHFYDCSQDKTNIENAVNNIIDLIKNVAKTLNKWFYRSLERESDYLQSEAAIIETIEANEWYFDLAGNICTPDPELTIAQRANLFLTRVRASIQRVRTRFSLVELVLFIPTLAGLVRAFLTA